MTILSIKNESESRASLSPFSWMITFADLLTLLLGFFVLRLSMSSINNDLVKHALSVSKEAQEAETAQQPDSELLQPDANATDKAAALMSKQPEARSEGEVEQAQAKLSHVLTESLNNVIQAARVSKKIPTTMQEVTSDVWLDPQEGGTKLFLGGSTFASGSDELSFRAQELIATISKVLMDKLAKAEKLEVIVEGHTDNIPINNGKYPSNWELSAARAIAVARQMIDAGVDPQTVSVTGYADSRPLDDNGTDLGRYRNRRVEVNIRTQE